MTAQATGYQQLLKGINRMALVRLLCQRPGLSRADLASESGRTRSTISLLGRELMAEGWLQGREVVATGDPGRRPTPLFIDPSRLLLLGAEVGVDALRVVAATVTSQVLARVVELGAAFVQAALDTLHACARAAGLEPPTVRTSHFGADAVAVGAAALVRYRTTRPLHAVDVRSATEPADE